MRTPRSYPWQIKVLTTVVVSLECRCERKTRFDVSPLQIRVQRLLIGLQGRTPFLGVLDPMSHGRRKHQRREINAGSLNGPSVCIKMKQKNE